DSAVGSQNGVSPFTTGGAGIAFVNLSSLAGSCTTVATVGASGSLIAYNNYSCGSSPSLAAAVTPDIGFSDVEPKIFGYSSVPGATVATVNQLMFGVPVSLALYNELQRAQGLTVTTTADSANRPSLSAGQVAGLYSSNLLQVTDLMRTGVAPTLADTQIYLVRRGDASGSQRTADVNFLSGYIIAPSPTSFAGPDSSGATSTVTSNANYATLTAACGLGATPPTAGRVFAGNGSGDVRNCLNFHGANRYAVGVLSMESNEAGSNWRWVKIDGVMPTVANVIRGKYHHWVEQASLLRNGASASARAAFGQLKADLSNPTFIDSLNGSFTVFASEPAGQQRTGILALPESLTGVGTGACHDWITGTVTADNDPVNIHTKSAAGSPDSAVKPGIAICPPRL
ncbi:MAG: hypothetical protein WBP72_17665, partial [Rhodocyclaceae bacterium]